MKAYSNSVLILAATLTASAFVPLSAAPKDVPPIAYSVSTLALASRGDQTIERGTSRSAVWLVMGRPRQELSPDVWLYRGYHADLDLASEQGCDTLVVTFSHDRVADLKFVNHSAATIIAADLKHMPATQYVAKK